MKSLVIGSAYDRLDVAALLTSARRDKKENGAGGCRRRYAGGIQASSPVPAEALALASSRVLTTAQQCTHLQMLPERPVTSRPSISRWLFGCFPVYSLWDVAPLLPWSFPAASRGSDASWKCPLISNISSIRARSCVNGSSTSSARAAPHLLELAFTAASARATRFREDNHRAK
jgi:hypothetical protein